MYSSMFHCAGQRLNFQTALVMIVSLELNWSGVITIWWCGQPANSTSLKLAAHCTRVRLTVQSHICSVYPVFCTQLLKLIRTLILSLSCLLSRCFCTKTPFEAFRDLTIMTPLQFEATVLLHKCEVEKKTFHTEQQQFQYIYLPGDKGGSLGT